MATPLDVHGYPVSPRELYPGAWFYEQREGLVLVIEGSGGTRMFTLPWGRLERAVDNHRRIKARRKK